MDLKKAPKSKNFKDMTFLRGAFGPYLEGWSNKEKELYLKKGLSIREINFLRAIDRVGTPGYLQQGPVRTKWDAL